MHKLALLTALLLTGCAHYQWARDGQETDFYRWVVVEHSQFPTVCGFQAARGFRAGSACALRLNDGVILPGDIPITGKGNRLCVVFSTLTEEEARRTPDADGLDLFSHELKHCNGWGHQ